MNTYDTYCDALLEMIDLEPNSINEQDINGNTPLHRLMILCYGDKPKEARRVLARYLERFQALPVNHEILNNGGKTALHLAALTEYHGMTDIDVVFPTELSPVQLLLSAFKNPGLDVLSTEGATALGYATERGAISDMQALLQAGASTTVHEKSDYDVLTLLPDFLHKIQFHIGLYERASDHISKKIETALIAMIDDIQQKKPTQGRLKALLQQPLNHIQESVAMDASMLTMQDEDGMTLYHHLARIQIRSELNMPVVDFLFDQAGVNLSLQDYTNNTPVHLALINFAHWNSAATVTLPRFIQCMKTHGFDYSLVNKDHLTVYHLATSTPYSIDGMPATQFLIQDTMYHPAINRLNKRGETALTLACEATLAFDIRTIEALIKQGASECTEENTISTTHTFIENQITHHTSRQNQKKAAHKLYGDRADIGPSASAHARKVEQYSAMLKIIDNYPLYMISLGIKEVCLIAAVLSQGVRPKHIFYNFPKDLLVKFALFSTHAPLSQEAEPKANESLTRWLRVKTAKPSTN